MARHCSLETSARWEVGKARCGHSSIVRACNAGDDSEDDEYRRQNADRYANNAGDKACDCLGAAGVTSRLRVDLVLDPAADDDAADTHQPADDAAQSQDRAEDAEDRAPSAACGCCAVGVASGAAPYGLTPPKARLIWVGRVGIAVASTAVRAALAGVAVLVGSARGREAGAGPRVYIGLPLGLPYELGQVMPYGIGLGGLP